MAYNIDYYYIGIVNLDKLRDIILAPMGSFDFEFSSMGIFLYLEIRYEGIRLSKCCIRTNFHLEDVVKYDDEKKQIWDKTIANIKEYYQARLISKI